MPQHTAGARAEQAGFEAVHMTGFGGGTADQARRVSAAVGVPVVADGDTGYGNAVNVARTMSVYEQAGVAAVQLEDQVSPRRCGHMSGESVISRDEMGGDAPVRRRGRR